jgi:predicted AAA+ superfamily ATPase
LSRSKFAIITGAPSCSCVGVLRAFCRNIHWGGRDQSPGLPERLKKVFGRLQSPWIAAHGDETYEIIRRRLFQMLDTEGEKAREGTIKAFHDLYKKNAAEFPPEAKEGRYLELLRLSYPIHPELFDRLSKDWAALPLFQRTRWVLRFMANVVGVLWQQQIR